MQESEYLDFLSRHMGNVQGETPFSFLRVLPTLCKICPALFGQKNQGLGNHTSHGFYTSSLLILWHRRLHIKVFLTSFDPCWKMAPLFSLLESQSEGEMKQGCIWFQASSLCCWQCSGNSNVLCPPMNKVFKIYSQGPNNCIFPCSVFSIFLSRKLAESPLLFYLH